MPGKGWSSVMHVTLINPNSTAAMTSSALAAARRAAPEIHFEGWTSANAPPAIEGAEDGARAVPPLLKLVRKASDEGTDAIIIACFDDTGLAQAQALAACPVLGIGQASFVMASLLPGPAAVITTVAPAVPVIRANIAAQGHSKRIGTVLAANVPVLTLEHDPPVAAAAFQTTATQLPKATRTLILGCAGAVSIQKHLQQSLSLTVLDGVTSAALLCQALGHCGMGS